MYSSPCRRALVFVMLCLTLAGCVTVPAAAPVSPTAPVEAPAAAPEATTPRTIVISASGSKDDAGNWKGESGPFLKLLANGQDVSAELPYCKMVWEGELYDQPVSVVTMGVGKVTTAACMFDVLDHYQGADGVKEVIWSGIAGITPMFGGMVDASGQRRHDKPTVTGDVCTTAVARDFDLQRSSVAEGAWWLGATPKPAEAITGSLVLAEELYQAGLVGDWPDLPDNARDNTIKYNGEEAVRKPTVFGPEQCAEVTADNFWHGVLEDTRARELAAADLSRAYGKQISPDEIIILTAMEGTGWGNVLRMYTKATGRDIPWAISRSASNFDHPWFKSADGVEFAVTAQESIDAGMKTGGGSAVGQATAAIPVLKLLELRSK